jgi:hypothetical protein
MYVDFVEVTENMSQLNIFDITKQNKNNLRVSVHVYLSQAAADPLLATSL